MDEKETKQQIASRLREYRKAAGYKSANSFAEVLGIKPAAYREYEQGRSSITYSLAWKMADVLGITLDELAGRPAPGTTGEQAELIDLYRCCTAQRKQRLIEYARDAAYLSRNVESE